LNAQTHFFSTPPLFGQKFRGVPLGVDPPRWGCKERTSQANWWWNYFWRFPTYVITIPQRYGQTDRQTTCHSNTALCVASRGKQKKSLSADFKKIMFKHALKGQTW